MKKFTLWLSILCLLLASCSQSSPQADWSLYLPSDTYLNGPALVQIPFPSKDDNPPSVEQLLEGLRTGGDSAVQSPFPKGTALRSWYQNDELLHINLSEPYGGLSGIALTLADYSIALTLCQLPGVEGVSITVENDPIPFRYRQVLTPEDILLSDFMEENH